MRSWVIAGGGTGGHVTLALALGEEIARRGEQVLFVGSDRGFEARWVPQAGFERSNFDLYGHSGIALTLSGRVLNADCEPVAGAQVLMWHATPSPPGVVPATAQSDPDYDSAVYDHANQAGQATPDGEAVPTGEQMYYGWVTTDDEGRWEFTTLRPGWYLNGATYRPAHLHVRVYLGAEELLTTQLYFPDDPFNELDGIQVNACNNELCYVEYQDEDGAVATFDLAVLS